MLPFPSFIKLFFISTILHFPQTSLPFKSVKTLPLTSFPFSSLTTMHKLFLKSPHSSLFNSLSKFRIILTSAYFFAFSIFTFKPLISTNFPTSSFFSSFFITSLPQELSTCKQHSFIFVKNPFLLSSSTKLTPPSQPLSPPLLNTQKNNPIKKILNNLTIILTC